MYYIDQLLDLCLSKHIKISVAESCTSGLVASILSSKSGSSSYFNGGIIAYNNDIKINLLNIEKELINNKTEVSEEVVAEMAKSACSIFKSDYSIATSGYAGPTGGDINNPIGTVFIGIAKKQQASVKKIIFEGSRKEIVHQAANKSIELLYNTIKKHI